MILIAAKLVDVKAERLCDSRDGYVKAERLRDSCDGYVKAERLCESREGYVYYSVSRLGVMQVTPAPAVVSAVVNVKVVRLCVCCADYVYAIEAM